jgi:hypothetical protein
LYVTDSVGEEKPEYLEFTCLVCKGLKKRITYKKIRERLDAYLAEPDEPE